MTKQKFWLIGSSGDVLAKALELMDRRPPALVIDYDLAAHLRDAEDRQTRRQLDVAGVLGPINPVDWGSMKLTIKDEAFLPDFMTERAWFVSARLREIMGLGPDVAQYLPVDSSACHPRARAQDYQVLDCFAVRNAIDAARSEIEYADYVEQDGTRSKQLLYTRRIVWRDDFTADVPVFRDPHDQRFFATDDFAEKVLRAGIADMVFQDVASERAQRELVLKSL